MLSRILCIQAEISIHAPHARSDGKLQLESKDDMKFQSTLLMRGATIPVLDLFAKSGEISIHAPHARSDMPFALSDNPFSLFQSTLLMRGATIQSAKYWSGA